MGPMGLTLNGHRGRGYIYQEGIAYQGAPPNCFYMMLEAAVNSILHVRLGPGS